MRTECMQIEFNNIFNEYNRLFFLCFEHVHRKKNHVVDYLAKQKVFREVDLVVWL
jgi:hypothetical protein